MVMLGHPTTLPVTMEDMLHHAKAVSRGARQALLVGDMPFMSYQASIEQAITNAGRFVQEAGMHAVKLEGGGRVIEITKRLTEIGIPVMGHLGLTPQFVHQMGGFKVQGKTDRQAAQILADSKALEQAGAFSLVLEGVPSKLAATITNSLRIPTIGIGAGPACDGQVLVFHDFVGLTTGKAPKFVKRYANLADEISRAAGAFVEDVREGRFPGPEHEYTTNGSTPAKDPTEVRYGG
jgi:3-methyl-2-oxobutanoate hydroxymethyltransferase